MLLSRYHTLGELTHSAIAQARGLDNTPPPAVIESLRRLARGLDEVRDLLKHPLTITSGYRSPELNGAVGGVPTSQHCRGEAADFDCAAFGSPYAVARALDASTILFDQCILEFGRWVHVSFAPAPRRRALTIYSAADGYLDGIVAHVG